MSFSATSNSRSIQYLTELNAHEFLQGYLKEVNKLINIKIHYTAKNRSEYLQHACQAHYSLS